MSANTSPENSATAFDPSGSGSEIATDVVVVGGGLAGLCAALAAVESGAEVVLVEKLRDLGGSTVLSGGFFAFAGTKLQADNGIEDTPEMLFRDLLDVSGGRADQKLLRAYCDGQLEMKAWLEEKGVVFSSVELSSGQSVARSHKTDSPTMVARLLKRLEESGRAKIMWGHSALRLHRPSSSGRVEGVWIGEGGEQILLRARGGVVLATGGFSRSEELLSIFAPQVLGAMYHGGSGNSGDGLKMAWQLGAGLADMASIKTTFGTHPRTGPERHEIVLACYMGAIIVNKKGERFVDESKSYKTLGEACLRQVDGLSYQIFDQGVRERSKPGVVTVDLDLPKERGLLLEAQTLEELAALCGLDPATLVNTVNQYNEGVEQGIDKAFGRDGLCHHAGELVKLDRAPFYAYPSVSFLSSTYCGITVDPEARVLDVFGSRIEGLYAAGELVGGFHGNAYMTGSSLGKAVFLGVRAGRGAASDAAVVEH